MTKHDAFWVDRGGYKQPVFLDDATTNPMRKSTWQAFGALCGIFLSCTGLGPVPVCPLLIAVALLSLAKPDNDNTRRSTRSSAPPIVMVTDLDTLQPMLNLPVLVGLDRDIAAALQPWLELAWNEPLPQSYTHPARQFVIQILEKNVSGAYSRAGDIYLTLFTADRSCELAHRCYFERSARCMVLESFV